jgi:hypothetical protein
MPGGPLLSALSALLDPEAVQLVLLLMPKLPLSPDRLQAARRCRFVDRFRALILQQDFPSLAFLQRALFRLLLAVQ